MLALTSKVSKVLLKNSRFKFFLQVLFCLFVKEKKNSASLLESLEQLDNNEKSLHSEFLLGCAQELNLTGRIRA